MRGTDRSFGRDEEADQLAADTASAKAGTGRSGEIVRVPAQRIPGRGTAALTAAMAVGAALLYCSCSGGDTGTIAPGNSSPGGRSWSSSSPPSSTPSVRRAASSTRHCRPTTPSIVIGFFLVSPGRAARRAARRWAARARAPAPDTVGTIAYRLAALALGTSLAVLAFRGLTDLTGVAGAVGWSAAVLGAAVASEMGMLAAVAPHRSRERSSRGRAPAGRGAGARRVGRQRQHRSRRGRARRARRVAAVLLFVPFASYAVLLRAYTSERQRVEHLRALYDSMRLVDRGSGSAAESQSCSRRRASCSTQRWSGSCSCRRSRRRPAFSAARPHGATRLGPVC